MRYNRPIGFALVTVLAASATAALASAQPEFLHSAKDVTKTGFTVKSKAAVTNFEVSETKYKISCTSSVAAGKIRGTTKIEAVIGRFKGCKAKKGVEKHECEVKSTEPAGKKEEVITKTLKGRLGSVAKAEAESEVGMILEPAEGEVYLTLTSSTECLPKETAEVVGSLIGEITTTKKEQKTGEVLYKVVTEKEQMIKKFTGESATHELELFGVRTPLEAKDEIEFEEPVEVT